MQNRSASSRDNPLILSGRILSSKRATPNSTRVSGCHLIPSAQGTSYWRTPRSSLRCLVASSRWRRSGRILRCCRWPAQYAPNNLRLSPNPKAERDEGGQMGISSKAVPITMLTFVLSSMLAVGLSLTVREILAPLRNYRLIVLALLANFVLMPLAAHVITKLLRLDQPLGIALLLLGTAAGAPSLPLLARISKGNLAFAVGLMVLLMVVTVAYMPLVLPLLLEGVSVDPMKIGRSLVLLMLLPLAIGLLVRARLGRLAAKIQPSLSRVSSLSLIVLIALLLITNVQNLLSLYGTRGVLASILFVVAGSGVGWVLGGPQSSTRGVMALGTAQRNIAAALVVGGQSFKDPRVIVMVVVVAIVGLLLLMPLARYLAKRSPLASNRSSNASKLQSLEQSAADGARRGL